MKQALDWVPWWFFFRKDYWKSLNFERVREVFEEVREILVSLKEFLKELKEAF